MALSSLSPFSGIIFISNAGNRLSIIAASSVNGVIINGSLLYTIKPLSVFFSVFTKSFITYLARSIRLGETSFCHISPDIFNIIITGFSTLKAGLLFLDQVGPANATTKNKTATTALIIGHFLFSPLLFINKKSSRFSSQTLLHADSAFCCEYDCKYIKTGKIKPINQYGRKK